MLLLCALLGSQSLMAQNAVRGTVLDETGQPVIGATVTVDDTYIGTTTDTKGEFEIKAAIGSSITVQYLGYDDVKARLTQNMKITLTEGAVRMDDVVVVGYGTQTKATLTGSASVVGSDELSGRGTLTTPLQALQGTVPGVTITRTSSAPSDEGWGMTLRGSSSVNSTSPLIIIDGVEAQGGTSDLSKLNPDDIESMNFLKDASAAIYGSKAAGGVVLVTTKKAKAGRTVVTYNGSYTLKVIGLQPDMMSLDEWCDATIEAQTNDGYDSSTSKWIQYAIVAQAYKNGYISNTNSSDPMDTFFIGGVEDFVFQDTDWQDILWGNSFSTQHDLSISGGTEKSTFRVSLGYMHNDSALQWGTDYSERYNVRTNNTFQFTDRLSLESAVSYSREMTVSPTHISDVLTSSNPQPGLPSATIDGKQYAWGAWTTPNWLAELGGENNLRVNVFNISEKFNYAISDKFSLTAQGGYTNNLAVRDIVSEAIDWYTYDGSSVTWQYPTQEESYYTKSYATTEFYSAAAYANYNETINNSHHIGVMVGTQYDYKAYERTETSITDINSSLSVPSGSGTISTDPDRWHEAMSSYFGRINYDYQYKYLVDINFRYDGSSKFSAENRWALFGGGSLGWRISEEDFFEPIKGIFSDLKLRASYGELGNQSGIGRYDGMQLYNYNSSGGVYLNGEQLTYITTNGEIASTERTWERVCTYNVGVDFGFFNNRLTGSADAYQKRNNNMLISADYSGVLGDSAPEANLGKFKARGGEFMLNWSDTVGDLRYMVGGNISYSTNVITDIGASSVISNGYNSTIEGYPIGSYFGLQYSGKIENEDQLEKYMGYYYENNGIDMPSTLRVGDNMYEDVNGDGLLNSEDYVYLGTSAPEISYSFNAGLYWRNFDFSVTFQGVANRTVYRNGGDAIPMRAAWLNSSNYALDDIWSTDNMDGYYPPLSSTGTINTYNYQCSTWSVENGSYVRLKNLTLGYSLSESVLRKLNGLSALRIYFSGADLWEFTSIRDGWDPEQTSDVSSTERYPFNRTFTFGVNVTF